MRGFSYSRLCDNVHFCSHLRCAGAPELLYIKDYHCSSDHPQTQANARFASRIASLTCCTCHLLQSSGKRCNCPRVSMLCSKPCLTILAMLLVDGITTRPLQYTWSLAASQLVVLIIQEYICMALDWKYHGVDYFKYWPRTLKRLIFYSFIIMTIGGLKCDPQLNDAVHVVMHLSDRNNVSALSFLVLVCLQHIFACPTNTFVSYAVCYTSCW
jgi:hypothetical protein